MNVYEQFCYHSSLPNGTSHASVIVWRNGDFGLCFEHLIFLSSLNAIFGLFSALYAGLSHTLTKRTRKPLFLLVRATVSLLIAVNSIVELSGGFWLVRERPYAILLSEAVTAVSWVVHLLCVLVLCGSIRHSGRGPLALNAVWFLTLVGAVVHFRTVVRWNLDPHAYHYLTSQFGSAYFSLFLQITTYVHLGLQCLYGITLAFKAKPVKSVEDIRLPWKFSKRLCVQNEEDDGEKQPLISSRPQAADVRRRGKVIEGHDYGAIPLPALEEMGVYVSDKSRLDADEGRANVLSLLTFWWVEPLLRRGDMGLLERPEDLLCLPRALQTAHVREYFQQILQRHRRPQAMRPDDSIPGRHDEYRPASKQDVESETSITGYAGRTTHSTTVEVQIHFETDSEIQPSTVPAAGPASKRDPLLPSSSPQSVEHPPTDHHNSGHPKSSHHRDTSVEGSHGQGSQVSLFWVMSRAFGLHYYPLGVLKLLADILGFAGPLLLHALVAFMENRNVSCTLYVPAVSEHGCLKFMAICWSGHLHACTRRAIFMETHHNGCHLHVCKDRCLSTMHYCMYVYISRRGFLAFISSLLSGAHCPWLLLCPWPLPQHAVHCHSQHSLHLPGPNSDP